MFSILLVLFAIIGLGLLFFLILLLVSAPKKCSNFGSEGQSIEIVKVIEAHRKILPICSAQGWCLVSSSHSLRCWKKEFLFLVMGSPVNIYGCTKQINCSSVIVLNVIADVSSWPEWDVWAEGQTVHLEVSEDPALHGDHYMQCDQLVLTTTVLQTKPDVVMYRFGNLESNGVGWILLWNAKQLEWTFYLAQPIDNCFGEEDEDGTDERCTLTAISGSEDMPNGDRTLSERLCAKVHNLSEAIAYSQLKLRPLQPLVKSSTSTPNNPHFPTIHSALNDLPEKPCVLLKIGQTYHFSQRQNSVLAVVPSAWDKSGRVMEFQLVSHLLRETVNGTMSKDGNTEEKRRSRRRQKLRSDSVTAGSPMVKVKLWSPKYGDVMRDLCSIKHLQAENRRSSSLSSPRDKPPELTVTAADEDAATPAKVNSSSLLNLLFHRRKSSDASDQLNKSPTGSRCSTPPQERKKIKKNANSSASSQEDLSSNALTQENRTDKHGLNRIIPDDIADSVKQMLKSKTQ